MLMTPDRGGRAHVEITKEKRLTKHVLALPDLEESKAAVLNSLTSKSGQRTYDRAITDFVEWYCSEPRLSFDRTVVLQYRIFSNRSAMLLRRSICGSQPYGVSPSKRRILVCSVRNCPPAFDV
jgi:hypothetical protein